MTHPITPAEVYDVEDGDTFVRFDEIRPEHARRVFEFRHPDGSGYRGRIVDASYYQLQGTAVIQFEGEQLGIFRDPDTLILLKGPDFRLPDPDPATPVSDQVGAVEFMNQRIQEIRATRTEQ